MKVGSFSQITIMVAMLIGIAPLLAGCFSAAIGTGAWLATAASEERGIKSAANDLAIRTRINGLWLDHNEALLTRVDISISEGRVLLTGRVPTQQERLSAVHLAWNASGVKEVINEIQVSGTEGTSEFARDSWISAQLKTILALDEKVNSINYSIDTVDGTVYLMGIAGSGEEVARVRNHARQIKYVRRVVNYVIMKTDSRRKVNGTNKE
ncbi:MAG: BON domain-containing protein [Alphaproteobacteria bacterium]